MSRQIILAFALLAFAIGNISLPVNAAFVRATVVQMSQVRDSGGAITGIRFLIRMQDDTIPSPEAFEFMLTGLEFEALPAGAAAKRAALVAIIKRETQKQHAAWVARIAVQPLSPIVRDPATDLGVTEVTNFSGAAAPFPSPTP